MQRQYTVKEVARLTGLTVRALHIYDRNGLLRPARRSAGGYRLYEGVQLLRLQQILFYKELGIPLKEIRLILDEPGFDRIAALEGHRKGLVARKNRINAMLKNIDNTIAKLKSNTMISPEELYEGMPKEEAAAYRKAAIAAYGAEVVEHAERHLQQLTRDDLKSLVERQHLLAAELCEMKHLAPDDVRVQELVAQHYLNTRKLWGTAGATDKQAQAYAGLGQLYLTDERFTAQNGKADPAFARFMSLAMAEFTRTRLA